MTPSLVRAKQATQLATPITSHVQCGKGQRPNSSRISFRFGNSDGNARGRRDHLDRVLGQPKLAAVISRIGDGRNSLQPRRNRPNVLRNWVGDPSDPAYIGYHAPKAALSDRCRKRPRSGIKGWSAGSAMEIGWWFRNSEENQRRQQRPGGEHDMRLLPCVLWLVYGSLRHIGVADR